MKMATVTGKRFHRSAAEQVEYWANIGCQVADAIDPDVLLSVTAGLARISVEPVFGPSANPDEVFSSLEADRERERLTRLVGGNTVKYQISPAHPGYLESIDRDGQIVVGQFKGGEFIAAPDLDPPDIHR